VYDVKNTYKLNKKDKVELFWTMVFLFVPCIPIGLIFHFFGGIDKHQCVFGYILSIYMLGFCIWWFILGIVDLIYCWKIIFGFKKEVKNDKRKK
jgi:hypothetical protein